MKRFSCYINSEALKREIDISSLMSKIVTSSKCFRVLVSTLAKVTGKDVHRIREHRIFPREHRILKWGTKEVHNSLHKTSSTKQEFSGTPLKQLNHGLDHD